MANETSKVSRMFEPMVGSDALFLDPTTGTSTADSQSQMPPSSAAADDQSAAPDHRASASDASATGSASNPPGTSGHYGDPQPLGGGGTGGGGGDAGGGDTTGGGDTGGGTGGDAGGGDTGGGGTSGGGGTGGGGDVLGGLLDQLPNGISPIGGSGDNGIVGDVDNLISNVVQTVGAIGSSSPLNDIVNGHGLFDPLGGALGGTGLGDALGNTLGGSGTGHVVSNLGNTVVSDLGQTAGAITNGGSIDGVLNAVGDSTGNLVDGVLNAVDGATGTGLIGSVLDGLGSNVVNGAVGGTGLLAGTPLEGIQGDGALISSNALNGDGSSSPSSLLQVGAGTDQSNGLINVDAVSNRDTSESNHIVDTNVGPQTSGNGATADLLGANQDSSGSLIDADAGQHQGPSLATVNAGTNADQFQFPALGGTGLDSLVGEVGQLPGNPVGDVGGGDLLPISAGVDGHALLDVGADGTLGLGDNNVATDGTQIMVNTPLHGALAA